MKIYLALISFALLSCSSKEQQKNNIDFDEVEKITLIKNPLPSDTTKYGYRFIDTSGIATILNSLNNSQYSGIYKYFPQFFMSIYLKSGDTLRYRISNDLIKIGRSDFTYRLSSKTMFDSLYSHGFVFDLKEYQKMKGELFSSLADCESAKRIARKNFSENKIQLIAFGLLDDDKESNYHGFLSLHYNFYIFNSCLRYKGFICYENEIQRLICEKYGADFFKITKQKADSLYYLTHTNIDTTAAPSL